MKTLDDIDNFPIEDNTYNLIIHAPRKNYMLTFAMKDEGLSSIEKDRPYLYDDYTWVIPRKKYIYFVNTHLEGSALRIDKSEYIKLFTLPRPKFYPLDQKEALEGSPSGMKFHDSYIDIAKSMVSIKLNFDDNVPINYASPLWRETIISKILLYERD